LSATVSLKTVYEKNQGIKNSLIIGQASKPYNKSGVGLNLYFHISLFGCCNDDKSIYYKCSQKYMHENVGSNLLPLISCTV